MIYKKVFYKMKTMQQLQQIKLFILSIYLILLIKTTLREYKKINKLFLTSRQRGK